MLVSRAAGIAAAAVYAIVDVEMPLHVSYCARWGLSEEQMAGASEAMETIAYTRFVLERGLAGDLLDLHVAPAPCLVGYGESGERHKRLSRQLQWRAPWPPVRLPAI